MTTRRLQSILIVLLALATGGCVTWDDAGLTRFIERAFIEPATDASRLGVASALYRDAHGRWPEDLSELRHYMEETQPDEARQIEWDRLQDVAFTPKEDGGLRITCTVLPGLRFTPAKASDAVTSELDLGIPKPPGPFLPPIRIE